LVDQCYAFFDTLVFGFKLYTYIPIRTTQGSRSTTAGGLPRYMIIIYYSHNEKNLAIAKNCRVG